MSDSSNINIAQQQGSLLEKAQSAAGVVGGHAQLANGATQVSHHVMRATCTGVLTKTPTLDRNKSATCSTQRTGRSPELISRVMLVRT